MCPNLKGFGDTDVRMLHLKKPYKKYEEKKMTYWLRLLFM
jgi:hypothetical protein